MDRHHFERGSDVYFCELYVVVSKGKFVKGNQAVNTGDSGILGRRRWLAIFYLKFPCGYANGADAKDFEGGFIERSNHEAWFDFFPNEIFTTSGSAWADWRLLQLWFWESVHSTPGFKP